MTLGFCPNCTLVQLLDPIPAEVLYRDDYPYYTSAIPSLVKHYAATANKLIARRGLNGEHLVIEIASNDGYLLRVFRDHGIRVLGIDPARGPVETAVRAGVPTLCTFFNQRACAALHR